MNSAVGFKAAREYPLWDAIFGRRSRRVATGATFRSGSLSFQSKLAPQPLSRLEEAMLIEVNIGTDGELDYEPEVLERLDWVIASVHTSFRISPKRMTERVIAAIEIPLVDCIGHPTGRLIN